MPSNRIELPFPLKGISGDSAFGRTPEGMSPDALNVTGYDAVGDRLRGGQRPGLSKFWTTQLGGAVRVQALAVGTSAIQPNSGTGFTESFAHPDEKFWSAYPTLWKHYNTYGAMVGSDALFDTVAAADANCITAVADNELKFEAITASMANAHIYQGAVSTAGTEFTIEFTWKYDVYHSGNFYVFFRVNPAYNGECYVLQLYANAALDTAYARLAKATTGGITFGASKATMTGGGLDLSSDAPVIITVTAAGAVSLTVDGVSGVPPENTPMDSYATYTRIGFGTLINSGTNDVYYVDDFAMTGTFTPSEAGHDVRAIAVANGNVYIAEEGNEPLLASSGTGALAAATVRRMIGTTLHHGSSNDTGPEQYHQMIYFADGSSWKRLDLASRSVLTWAAAAGSLPVDASANKPTIIATYRDRIALSGLVDDPQNWFLSAVGDADDFDYGATTSATMAVAGNNSTHAGKVGDVVTALATYSDDVMIIGGDHTVWIMRGDPASRGNIDNMSYSTGISGSRAFSWDPFGKIHFFGAGTHWMMGATDAQPVPVSRGRMDRLWSSIDPSAYDIQLAWDVVRRGLHIFVVPVASGTSTHWFWDQRTDAYWPVQYPDDMNPTAVLGYDASQSDDTALLVGGYDGYVRKVDPTSKNDDATKITSYVLFNPINPGDSYRNTKLTEIISVMSSDTDAATVTVYSGDTPETALDLGKSHFARAVGAGRTVLHNRAAGNTLVVKVGNSTVSETWALEALEVTVSGAGRTRKGSL